MKLLQLRFLSLFLLISPLAKSQADFEFNIGGGIASYYGDLIEKDHAIFPQPSYSASVGVAHYFSPHWAIRGEFSALKVGAKDSKNDRADLKARNLSFNTNIYDLGLEGEYDLFDMTPGHRNFTPYAFLGIGIFHFNPYTTDRTGKKVYLQEKGTEGQGTAAYPDRKPYKKTLLNIPFGGGVKYALNNKVVLALEFKYRFIDTDYLDDVSMGSYPNMSVLAAKDPLLPGLTYRADELSGGAPYPANGTGLNRGNPNNNDAYYTLQAKVTWRFNCSRMQMNY